MAEEKVRFAIAGAGMGAVTHAVELQHIEDAELVAVSSRSEEKAKQFAEAHGAKSWYSDYRRLLCLQRIEKESAVLGPSAQALQSVGRERRCGG